MKIALKYTPKSEIKLASNFNLSGVDVPHLRLNQVMGVNGLVVMFIYIHCPYVKSIQHQLAEAVKQLQSFAVNAVAIMANDTADYAEDLFNNMQAVAMKLQFKFPYLLDDTQSTAKNYGAVCTPDFFARDHQGEI